MLYRVTLAYDGSDFEGWQLQTRRGARTVQGVLEAALGQLSGGKRVRVDAAGRTDAGVHALGQVASFELVRSLEAEELQRALNGLLPEDVRALEAAVAPPGFHARRSATGKLYRYLLDTGSPQLPTRRRIAGHVPWELDETLVREAAALYLGRHDFAAVASSGSSVKTTVRTVARSEAVFCGATLRYEVEADGFLRKMVRSLVGGLVAAGRRTVGIDALRRALVAGDRRGWPAPVEPSGLYLVRVFYPGSGMGGNIERQPF